MPIDFNPLQTLKDYFYPQPIPVPVPVQVQPEEEIQTQYSIWVMGGVAVAAITITIALKFFYRSTPAEEMFRACSTGNGDVVKKLLDGGFNANIRNSDGKSPLEIAMEQDHTRIMTLLIPKVDINASNKNGECPLHTAAKKGDTVLINLFVKNNANINALTKTGETPLDYATKHGRTAAASSLLSHNATGSLSLVNNLFEILLNAGNKDSLLPLIEKINPNKANTFGETPLHLAAKYGDPEIINKLIDGKGANVNAIAQGKKTPLYYAVANNQSEAAKALLSRKAAIDIVPEETSLLEVAIAAGNKDAIPLFLKKEDINKGNSLGETPLHFAAQKGTPESIKKLIEMGANANATTAGNKTPLYCATEARNVLGVTILLDYRANPNVNNDKGFTPLHIACKHYATCPVNNPELDKSYKIIELLLQAGADVNAEGGVGGYKYTPLKYANNDPKIEKLLFPEAK